MPKTIPLAIIGGGIAAACLAYCLYRRYHVEARIFCANARFVPASFMPIVLVSHKIRNSANPESVFFRRAFAVATDFYQGLSLAHRPQTALRFARNAKEARRWHRYIELFDMRGAHIMHLQDAVRGAHSTHLQDAVRGAHSTHLQDAVRGAHSTHLQDAARGAHSTHLQDAVRGAHIATPQDADGSFPPFCMHSLFLLEPAATLSRLFGPLRPVNACLQKWEVEKNRVALYFHDGPVRYADRVIFCTGAYSGGLLAGLHLGQLGGHMEFFSRFHPLPEDNVRLGGGYVYQSKSGLYAGASHRPLKADASGPFTPQDIDRARLRASVRHLLPTALPDKACAIASAIRGTTPDHLPFCGMLNDRVGVLAGFGGHGFCVAPYAAHSLAAQLGGEAGAEKAEPLSLLRPLRFTQPMS